MLINLENLVKKIQNEPWAQDASLGSDFWFHLMQWIEQDVMCDFLEQVIAQVDEIVNINPDLNEPQILENATRLMVEFLGAHSGSVRIYDPQTEQMLSYGSYPSKEDTRERYIPLEGSIAGKVVETRRPCLVPDMLDEELYLNKEIVYIKGVHSLMAIPIEIPRFFPRERDAVGVIQFYYEAKGRIFTLLEVQVATLMAKRLSAVIARKKVFSMQRVNEKKEAIVGHIFRTLGTPGGIKIKDV
ncbi:MAG: GAF domain-containing protein, partial [Thermodesulfobacteriota bacterium]|nr:GAF domain-containing protein [Thermodesulfobacteriota bacterium]